MILQGEHIENLAEILTMHLIHHRRIMSNGLIYGEMRIHIYKLMENLGQSYKENLDLRGVWYWLLQIGVWLSIMRVKKGVY